MIKTGVNRTAIDIPLDMFEKAQTALISALKLALPPKSFEVVSATDDTLNVAVILNRLKELLANDDYEAGDFLAENREALSIALGIDVFFEVESAIKQFDFDTALQWLPNQSDLTI